MCVTSSNKQQAYLPVGMRCIAKAYLQGAGLDLKLVAVPVHLLLLRQLLKQVSRDDVLCANQAGIWAV